MGKNLLIFSNIYGPVITGLFFFIYFIYFVIINNSRAPSFKYFVLFLVSFSLFLFGRPLQLMLGVYPVPLVIVNIRVFVFCSITITSIMIASNIFNNKTDRKMNAWIFVTGIILGLVYVVFNSLGTSGSYEVFTWGGITANDNLTPSRNPPCYGREVTIAVQVIIGLLLLVFSFVKILLSKSEQKWPRFIRNKIFLFNSGIFIFALTFIIGSLTKQWSLYYFFSIFSAFLFGAGVLIDIKELYNNYEKLVPFIKEDIIQNVAFSRFSKLKLTEMLQCLGKDSRLDTFIVIMMKDILFQTNYELKIFDNVINLIVKQLDVLIKNRNYILIPLDNQRIGLVVNRLNNQEAADLDLLDLLETIQAEIDSKMKQATAVGIGRSYENIEDLRTSYYEALNALEYAARLESCAVIHVDNIQQAVLHRINYPTVEKVRLLATIKLGDREESRRVLDDFMKGFRDFIADRPDVLKVRLYELIGSCIDSAILGGGDEKKLNEMIREYFNDIALVTDFETASKWLINVVHQIISIVAGVHKKRTTVIIEKAKKLIEKSYSSQLSYKTIARELFISSSYFLALFKQETGTTFVDYLTSVRINRSKELLLHTDKTITEIAFEVGFNNPNYFSSSFRRNTGIPAKEYRRKARERV